jgi:hypothetical protein
MIFKIYGWIALVQALLYVQDQKLAHYLHLPPRATFRAQMLGCLIGSFVSLGMINWQMSVVPDLCVPGQKDLLTCPYYVSRSLTFIGLILISRLDYFLLVSATFRCHRSREGIRK